MNQGSGHGIGVDTISVGEEVGGGTDMSDNEQPLSRNDQVIAILDIKALHPPPLPVESLHARATAQAVLMHTLRIPPDERKQAHNFALAMPLVATSVIEWVEQHLGSHRKESTLKTALCMALNPSKPGLSLIHI